jgi:hypothetical protein
MRRLPLAFLAAAAVLVAAPNTASAFISPGWHQIQNRQDPVCLAVTYPYHNGAEVRTDNCQRGSTQQWIREGSTFRVQYPAGKCLSVQWGTGYWNGAGSNVVADVCAGATTWTLNDNSYAGTEIRTYSPTGHLMCLDKAGWDVTVWDCWGPYWQKWNSFG